MIGAFPLPAAGTWASVRSIARPATNANSACVRGNTGVRSVPAANTATFTIVTAAAGVGSALSRAVTTRPARPRTVVGVPASTNRPRAERHSTRIPAGTPTLVTVSGSTPPDNAGRSMAYSVPTNRYWSRTAAAHSNAARGVAAAAAASPTPTALTNRTSNA